MRVRELEERERKESKKLADEDALRKIRVAEETIEHLQKKLAATKQVFEVLGFFFYSFRCVISVYLRKDEPSQRQDLGLGIGSGSLSWRLFL